jgi:hypothetical protein
MSSRASITHLIDTHGHVFLGGCRQLLRLPDGEKFPGEGRYHDRLRRTPGGRRFTHRRITSVWSEGNPVVITS